MFLTTQQNMLLYHGGALLQYTRLLKDYINENVKFYMKKKETLCIFFSLPCQITSECYQTVGWRSGLSTGLSIL